MKTDIKKVKAFAPKWWNPLFWLVVVLAPVFGMVAGTIGGAFCGLLIGYEKGLETASGKMHQINAQFP
ncbi:MAG: hypothetical protein IJ537_02635 [Bacteroidaceae bacterium]|nr:hypothetical protein [Bacteroidaceae bacterium]